MTRTYADQAGWMSVVCGQAAAVIAKLADEGFAASDAASTWAPEVQAQVREWIATVGRAGDAWRADVEQAQGRNLAMRPAPGSVPSAPDECVDVSELAAMLGLKPRQATNVALELVGSPPGRGRRWRIPRDLALAEKDRRTRGADRGR